MNRGLIAALVALIIIIVAGGWYWTAQQGPQPAAEQPAKTASNQPAESPAKAQPEQSAAEIFCGRDLSDTASRTSDAVTLAQAGGVVQIFQHEAALKDPYGCADFYLQHGLNIDAVDPRPDSKHLTPLLFAIQRNDPKMVHFMLDHGADLQRRGGPNKIKPYGYAVFLALNNRSTNYNEVISILDSALKNQQAHQDANKSDQGQSAPASSSETADHADQQ